MHGKLHSWFLLIKINKHEEPVVSGSSCLLTHLISNSQRHCYADRSVLSVYQVVEDNRDCISMADFIKATH